MTWLTYLPKTTGLPFGPRLQARAEKGRVFGMHGEDPIIPLVVDTATSYDASNVYTQEETISATSATFTGGHEPITRRTRMQIRESPSDSWTNKPWHVNKDVVSDLLDRAGQVRFQTRAEDADGQTVVSNTGIKTVNYAPLVVNTTTVSGTPYAGETVTCAQPTVTGGKAPYTYNYMWLDAEGREIAPASSSNTTTITTFDVGKVMNCYVSVNSADGQTGNTTTTNGVGPIQQYTIGTVTGQVDGVAYDPQSDVNEVMQNSTSILTVNASGDSPNLTYNWTVRQGNARITPQGAMCTVVHQSDPPQGEQVQCDVIDNYASDDNKVIRFAFLVAEQP